MTAPGAGDGADASERAAAAASEEAGEQKVLVRGDARGDASGAREAVARGATEGGSTELRVAAELRQRGNDASGASSSTILLIFRK